MNKVVKGVLLGVYITFILFLALIAFGASFVSDGPVPWSVHIMGPLMVVILFAAPPIIWHVLKTKSIGPLLPHHLRKHQNTIIIGFLMVWALVIGLNFIKARGN